MKELYIEHITKSLNVKKWQVENCIQLFEDGNSIPFISRYRKEKTGGLDDADIAQVRHWYDLFTELEKRKASIISTIDSQGKLTEELRARIEACLVSSELEDYYLPYRPRRRTRATMAKEKGLEPLADLIAADKSCDPAKEAEKYLGESVNTIDEALSGARDIIAERISECATVRESLRRIFRLRKLVAKATKAASAPETALEASKYKSYFNFRTSLFRVPSHSLLAILRARDEGFVSVSLDAEAEKCGNKVRYDFCSENGFPGPLCEQQVRMAVDDSYKRLLEPSITNEVIKEAKEKADLASIEVFGDNLTQLLLSSPVGQKRTLAIDPGFRNGCKTVCLDEQGNLLHHQIIFPHPPQSEKIKSIIAVADMVENFGIEVIAIGNGTAARETEDFIKRVGIPSSVKVYTVSEDGASIYSASEIAREEFPDEDVTVRGAVSIGRRLMDPLAELVKIDPKSLGVGQYQHDVDQGLLREKLDNTVVFCVNSVGVNLNTASPYLLSYVSGIGPSLAKGIVAWRGANGSFTSREQLRKVPKLGPKAFEQCAAFLRIKDAENPLDNSAVHPEAYHIVDKMAADLGVSTKELVGNETLLDTVDPESYVEGEFGLPTIRDILKELRKPGLDPRKPVEDFSFAGIHEIDDLEVGMELPGVVTNITDFGAFIDIGIHEKGLLHVSQMKARGKRGQVLPSKVLKLQQKVQVSVLAVDLYRKRISLGFPSGSQDDATS